jgi:hypothetical protein
MCFYCQTPPPDSVLETPNPKLHKKDSQGQILAAVERRSNDLNGLIDHYKAGQHVLLDVPHAVLALVLRHHHTNLSIVVLRRRADYLTDNLIL